MVDRFAPLRGHFSGPQVEACFSSLDPIAASSQQIRLPEPPAIG